MNPTFTWSQALTERLIIMVRAKYSERMIAKRLGISRTTVALQLQALGLKPAALSTRAARPTRPMPNDCATPSPQPQAIAPVVFPTFEDHPGADRDRKRGRPPQRDHGYSLVGNSSAMCVG